MNEDKNSSLRDMVAGYLAFAKRALRYWFRAGLVATLVVGVGLWWVVNRQRVYKSEASAAVHDVTVDSTESRHGEEAQAELRARLDQVYGSRSNLGRVIDEMGIYPWLRGRTSRLKIIESFQEALSYSVAGRDAFKLEFVYQDPVAAQRTVRRLLDLYTEQRREAGQVQVRNDLASVNTALAGLESVVEEQENRLERFETANSALLEQVRARRLGQLQFRLGGPAAVALLQPAAPIASEPGDSTRTRRLRIRLGALQHRHAAIQRSIDTPPAARPAVAPAAAPVEDSERTAGLRRTVTDLRERLARLRTTYTDEYPDVRATIRRLGDAERDLAAAVAADRARARGSAAGAAAPSPGASAEQLRSQLTTIAREIEQTRGALYASIREDRARLQSGAAAPAAAGAAQQRGARGNARRAAAPAPQVAPQQPAQAAAVAAAPEPAANGADARDEYSRPLGSMVEVESAWDRLTAELTTSRTRYQHLLSRKFELQAVLDTVNTTGADVLRVIDPPTLPVEPEPPGRTKMAMMVLALAAALALGIAGLSAFLDGRLYEPADLRRWGELPELPAIPDLGAARISEVTARPAPGVMRGATARVAGHPTA